MVENSMIAFRMNGKPLSIEQGFPARPFIPELVGHEGIEILVGKKSGRESIYYIAKKLGLTIPEVAVDEILQKVKTTAEANKRVLTQEEFLEIVRVTTHGQQTGRTQATP